MIRLQKVCHWCGEARKAYESRPDPVNCFMKPNNIYNCQNYEEKVNL